MKRFLTAVLSLVMVLTLLPVSAQAASVNPDTITVEFVLDGHVQVRKTMSTNRWRLHSVSVPTNAKEWVCDDMTVYPGQLLFAKDLAKSRSWDEKNPTITFVKGGVSTRDLTICYLDASAPWYDPQILGKAHIDLEGAPYRMDAAYCAGTLPQGYRFQRSELVVYGVNTAAVVVYVEEAPVMLTVEFRDDESENLVKSITVPAADTSALELPAGNWTCYDPSVYTISSYDNVADSAADLAAHFGVQKDSTLVFFGC